MVGSGMKTACKFVVVVRVDLKRGEVDADGGGVTDGWCAAHLEVADCRPNFALRFEPEVFCFVWKFCLVNDDEGALLLIEGECFHVKNVCGHRASSFHIKCYRHILPNFHDL